MFLGAFAAKVLIVRSKNLPGSALPIAGALVLDGSWSTSGCSRRALVHQPVPVSHRPDAAPARSRPDACSAGSPPRSSSCCCSPGRASIGAKKSAAPVTPATSTTPARRRRATAPRRVQALRSRVPRCSPAPAASAATRSRPPARPARVGPNLDQLQPSATQVSQIVQSGGGGMPSFSGKLSDAEIAAVASYVSTVAGH